jgi:hypothetical protein
MPAAAVPKAAVHKDRETVLGENEIGLARQWAMPAPPFDSMRSKNGGQFQFRCFVAFRPDRSHHFRAFVF